MLWHSCKGEGFLMMPLDFQAQLNSLPRETSLTLGASSYYGATLTAASIQLLCRQ